MLHPKLINPKSIVVIGGSDRLDHLGGSVLKNLIDQKYKGRLFVVNPKKDTVQGLRSYRDIEEIPEVDLAIIAIAANEIPVVVNILTKKKNTRGFIIYSSGFGELNEEGADLEKEITEMIDEVGGSLLGPNNIGLMNENYAGLFTSPLPKLNSKGVDFISGSGATAVFTIEAAHQIGLTFSGLYTVGNSAQIGIEEILEYLDHSYEEGKSSRVKMLYIEGIKNPEKFLRHCLSLRHKGCKILAIKAGISEEGTKAAASHTGAMASSNIFVEALFNKAGIIRCSSRYELINTAGVLLLARTKLTKFAIITHAGGPAVLLTDALCNNGLKVPEFSRHQQEDLSDLLYPGASVKNPVDLLATGNADQLDQVIRYCDQHIKQVEAIVVIFGSPGLGSVREVYEVISKKSKTSKKPIFAILPSVFNVKKDIDHFIKLGNLAFYDESLFGECMSRVMNCKEPAEMTIENIASDKKVVLRNLIDQFEDGFLDPEKTFNLLEAAGIKTVNQVIVRTQAELINTAKQLEYPLVLKVVGILHKTDQKGVVLNIMTEDDLIRHFKILMDIDGVTGTILQEMIQGKEIFLGTKKEPGFPPLILCGAGGIYVEVIKDFACALAPVSEGEARDMIESLKVFPILQGIRGEQGIDIETFRKTIIKLSQLVLLAPEIAELDINPAMASANRLIAVDARIRIQK